MPAAEETSTFKSEEPKPVVVRKESERDILSWTAPARPFKRRNREFFVTVVAIAGLSALVLFLIEGFLPVILIISVVFLFYVMSTVEPDKIEYKITNRGIKIADKKTGWEMMGRFWITRRFDSELLIIETLTFPGRLEIVIDSALKDRIEKEVGNYLLHEEIPPSYLDKAANWFSRKLPGN
jgi:hypothetical protein